MTSAEKAVLTAIQALRRDSIRFDAAMRLFEDSFIDAVLSANNGNQCAAALEMGVHRNTVNRKLDRPRWKIMATLNRGSLLEPEMASPIVAAVLNDAEANPSAYLPREVIDPITVERMMELATGRRA